MGKKALFLDNDEVFLFLIEEICKRNKIEIELNFADNPIAAVKYLEKCKSGEAFPEIIFTDLGLPKFSGKQLMKFYHKHYYPEYPSTKVYIVSSSENKKDKALAKVFPFVCGYIPKLLILEKLGQLMS